MRATLVSQLAIADALVATAWVVLAVDALARARAERSARAALGPVVGAGWQPSRATQGVVLASALGGAAVLELVSGRVSTSPGCTVVGLVLVATGLLVHRRARRALGPLWSGTIAVRRGHEVVEGGPYARVRHPIYLGVLLLALGSFLAHPSVATACLAGGLAIGFTLKIRAEERVLRATLGAAYDDYAARVPALLPRLGTLAVDDLLRRMGRHVYPARRRYALFLGAALWSGWLLSLVAGPGYLDLAGQVKGTDFMEFYAAGLLVLRGAAHRLYDLDAQRVIEHAITTPQDWPGLYGFLNPPFFALLFVPFALLPYGWAFVLWTVLDLLLVIASLRLIAGVVPCWRLTWRRALPWVLAFPPVFAAVSYGQNSLLSLFIFTITFVLLHAGRDFAAGLALGALFYKPQLVVVLAGLFVLDRRWRTLAGVAATGTALALVSWAMGAACVTGWVKLSRAFLAMQNDPGFPTWNMHSLYSFWSLLLRDDVLLTRLLAGLGTGVGFIILRRLQPPYGRDTLACWFAVALWGTALLAPHVFLYDLSPLVLAALLLWPGRRDHDLWHGGLAVLWLALVFSGPLTRAELAGLGAAVQLSVPLLALVGYALLRDASPASLR